MKRDELEKILKILEHMPRDSKGDRVSNIVEAITYIKKDIALREKQSNAFRNPYDRC